MEKYWGDLLDKDELYRDALIQHLINEGYTDFEAEYLAEKMYKNMHSAPKQLEHVK